MRTIPPEIVSGAQAAESKWQVPASVTIAQWAVESAWGTEFPGGAVSNNPFGIKARNGDSSVQARTREVDPRTGQSYYLLQSFRKFPSLAAALDWHGQLLHTGAAYALARAAYPDADKFADALTLHYATDPHYGTVLRQVMADNNLYRYNAHHTVGTPLPPNRVIPAHPALVAPDEADALDASMNPGVKFT